MSTFELNPDIVRQPPSDRLKIVAAVQRSTDLADLASGNPNFPVPPYILERVRTQLDTGYARYTDYFGSPELRQRISRYLETVCGITADPDQQVLVTHGVQQALYLVMRTILKPGDEVLLPSPHYETYEINARHCGAVPVPVLMREQDRWQPTVEALEAAITPRSAVLVFSNPSNPLGIIWPRSVLEGVARVAIKHNLLLLVDEVYRDFFDPALRLSLASLPGMQERTFTFNGFSKSHMLMGLRMGYVAGPAELMAHVKRLHHSIAICTSALGQAAALASFDCPAEQVSPLYAEIQDLLDLLYERLTSIPGITCVRPKSGFYLFPNFSRVGLSSLELAMRLIEQARVSTLPGTSFGRAGEGYLRLSVAAGRQHVELGSQRLIRFFEELDR